MIAGGVRDRTASGSGVYMSFLGLRIIIEQEDREDHQQRGLTGTKKYKPQPTKNTPRDDQTSYLLEDYSLIKLSFLSTTVGSRYDGMLGLNLTT